MQSPGGLSPELEQHQTTESTDGSMNKLTEKKCLLWQAEQTVLLLLSVRSVHLQDPELLTQYSVEKREEIRNIKKSCSTQFKVNV